MNRQFCLWILTVIVIASGVSSGRTQAIFSNYIALTTFDGLLDNNLSEVFCDANNVIWVGTQFGLQVYDGGLFYTFPYTGVNSLSGNNIRGIISLDKEHLVVGTEMGISRINIYNYQIKNLVFQTDNEIFEKVNRTQQLKLTKDSQIVVVATGGVHLVSHDLQLRHSWVFDKEEFRSVGSLQSSRIIELTDDHIVVVGPDISDLSHRIPSVYKINLKPPYDIKKIKVSLPGFKKYFGLFQCNDTIGIGFYQHISQEYLFYQIDLRTFQMKPAPNPHMKGGDYIPFINGISESVIGISTYPADYLYQYNFLANDWFLQKLHKPILIKSLTKSNSIWFAATEVGLLQGNPFFNYIENIQYNKQIDSLKEIATSMDHIGTHYVLGLYQGKIIEFNKGSSKFIIHQITNPFFKTKDINSVKLLDDENVMINSVGTYIYNLKTKKYKAFGGLDHRRILDTCFSVFFQDSKRNFWYGMGKSNGIAKYDYKRNIFKYYSSKHFSLLAPFSSFTDIAEDLNGDIWFTSISGSGLLKWNHYTDSFSIFYPKDSKSGIAFTKFNSIKIDQAGKIWLATAEHGLAYLNTERMELVQIDLGKDFGISIRSLAIDSKNNLWFVSQNRLGYYNTKKDQFYLFNTKHGLPQGNIQQIVKVKSMNDLFLVTSYGGSVLIRPDKFVIPDAIPQILIRRLSVNGKDVSIRGNGNQMNLRYDQNNLDINFSHSNLLDGVFNKYYYRFSGEKKDWIYFGMQPILRLSGLGYGKYKLEIQVCQNGNVCIEKQVMEFNIGRPFWLSPWFYLLVFGSFSFLIIWVFNSTNKAKLAIAEKERDREMLRNSISQDIHDEIGANLTRISLSAQAAALFTSLTKDELRDKIGALEAEARLARSKLRDIVFTVNAESDHIHDLQMYLKYQATQFWEGTKVQVKYDMVNELGDKLIHPDFKRHIILICKEAFNNCAKHSQGDQIKIVFYAFNSGKFLFSIVDNGIGFNIDQVMSGSHGISGIKKRAAEIKATCAIQSIINQGTTIIIEGDIY